jgi:hypothetical protein
MMRKVLVAALFVFTLACFAGAATAYAGGCGDKGCGKCEQKCESKCKSCSQKTCTDCKPKCESKATCQYPAWDVPCHPYQSCFTGSDRMCDTGCNGVDLPCKRSCDVCETVSRKIATVDECTGCTSVCYEHECVCTELMRPRVIPWWFQAGIGSPPVNIYLEEGEEAPAPSEADVPAEAPAE